MSRRLRLRRAGGGAIVPVAAGMAGCAGDSWLVDPAGAMAGEISRLAWIFGLVGAALWLVTLGFLAWAVVRGLRAERPATDQATVRAQTRAVIAAASATLFVLLVLGVVDFLGLRSLEGREVGANVLTVQVTGHQWWWELTYEPEEPTRRFATANELHVPVGRPVLLRLRSNDVIHSFWVPQLQGKRDLIPGYENTLWIQADEPGIYRGSCAEFCGMQHGKMRLLVVADPPEVFEAWYARQLAPAAPPSTPLAAEGQRAFLSGRCALCHAIRGTPARGQVAPDLTHLAGRLSLAAGVFPNERAYLGGWIVNPQHLKRGVRMPANPLPGPELHALLHYLEGLQ